MMMYSCLPLALNAKECTRLYGLICLTNNALDDGDDDDDDDDDDINLLKL